MHKTQEELDGEAVRRRMVWIVSLWTAITLLAAASAWWERLAAPEGGGRQGAARSVAAA